MEQKEEMGEEPFSTKCELLRNSKIRAEKDGWITGDAEKEMPASLSQPGDDKNNKEEEEYGMVSLIVTIDEELLRRIETSGHPDFGAERTAYAEVGEESTKENEPGEPPRIR